MPFHFLVSSFIPFFRDMTFSLQTTFTYLIEFIPIFIIVANVTVNAGTSMISLRVCFCCIEWILVFISYFEPVKVLWCKFWDINLYIMSSINKDTFTFSFLICIPLIFLFCFIISSRASGTLWKWSRNKEQPYLNPNLNEIGLSFSPFMIKLAVCLSYTVFFTFSSHLRNKR